MISRDRLNGIHMNATEIIVNKRDGGELSKAEIDFMVAGFTGGDIPDYQMSAFAMAVYLRNMTHQETAFLTQAMLHSGRVLDLSSIKKKTVDKHSTGGVGDKVSLPLVGIAGAAGVTVPMISGRGLGHTGGTLDKLESIRGFNVNLSVEEFIKKLKEVGVAMIGQTTEIAPADKRLYALRDVTGTVSSIPLMTASIMSKKLAEGAHAFVFDIKYGRGAFMKRKRDAKVLAESLVRTADLSGRDAIGYLTNMDQPLGNKIGNWLEVEETIDILRGEGPPDLKIITHLFAATMIMLGGKARSLEEGFEVSNRMVRSGKAFDKFVEMVKAQGGDAGWILNPASVPKANDIVDINSPSEGYVHDIDSLEVGLACVAIGAGRQKVDDLVDHQVGVDLLRKIGDRAKKGEPLAKLYINDESKIDEAARRIGDSFKIGSGAPGPQRLVDCQVTKDGIGEAPAVVGIIRDAVA